MVISFLRLKARNCLTRKLNNVAISNSVLHHSEAPKNTSQVDRNQQSARWSVLYFGSDEFALCSFKMLNERYRLKQLINRLEVVTAYKGPENSLIAYAKKNGIPVHIWPDVDLSRKFDLGLVVSFGHMIPASIIDAFPLGMINVHASLLPKLRGAAPIIHALMNGDSETGVTIMKIMPKKFDVGEILTRKVVPIDPDETMPELYSKLAKVGAQMLIETVERLPDVLKDGSEQIDGEATYARKVTASAATIKWNEMRAKNVYDLQRALTSLYHPTAKFEDATIKLLGIRVHTEPVNLPNLEAHEPGSVVYDKQKNLLLVRCRNETWISVDKVVMPGRRPMSARDFKNGFMTKSKNSTVVFQ